MSDASEFQPTKKWEKCAENAIIKTGTGMLVGGAFSLVLMGSPRTRIFALGFSGGIGAGLAWADCNRSFNGDTQPITVSFKTLMQSLPSSWTEGASSGAKK
eukprot:gb/GEZN01022182.1/.p1 GENE.gb/GEZN01022182.1/~~gb/GEZN01022182.1/.p1  ORF type:complete len:101 (+),score=15.77 gb/GEZN01022182.1/:34-336(+)